MRSYLKKRTADVYRGGRLDAAKETLIAYGVFPEEPPFTPEEVLDPGFFPEDRSFE